MLARPFLHSKKRALFAGSSFIPVLSWKYNSIIQTAMAERKQPSSSMPTFREALNKSRHVVILTGAGVSAESGIPTFRGEGGFWRKYQSQDLATPGAFRRDPSLVWEFYHYRRELVLTKEPNNAHIAIADYERRATDEGKHVVVITQNIDQLHQKAGSKNVLELHGSLFHTRCLNCSDVEKNTDSPICPALAGKGAPDPSAKAAKIPEPELPRCKKCSGLLRPHVVWFGESLDPNVLTRAGSELEGCDMCLVVGTSSVVYPAAMFAPEVAARGIPVAEFNLEATPATLEFGYHFEGPCGTTVPEALAP